MTETGAGAESRTPLSKERVLLLPWSSPIGGASRGEQRKLGQELGGEAMARYSTSATRATFLTASSMSSSARSTFRTRGVEGRLRERVMTARQVMLRHSWAPGVMEERKTVGPAFLAYLDAVMSTLRAGGFSIELAHHTIHVMGSRILGFDQDLFEDKGGARPDPEAAAQLARVMAVNYPNLAELALAASHEGGLGGCDDDVEFAFGLDLILEGLDRMRVTSEVTPKRRG